mgnify:CR=1 FL=1
MAVPGFRQWQRSNHARTALWAALDLESSSQAFRPLAHPDRAAHDAGDIVRLWELDAQSGAFRREYAYPLDPPASFQRDCAAGPVARNDIKISELCCLPDGSLLVLERVTLSTHIHRIRPDVAQALPPAYVEPAHRPTLEQVGQSGAAAAGIALLHKEPVFSTDAHPEIGGDLEGMLWLDDGSLLLANDNDYGIEGAATRFWLAVGPLS